MPKPVGWREEPARHALAAHGVKTTPARQTEPRSARYTGPKITDLGSWSEGEHYLWLESPTWVCQLENEQDIHLGLMLETINWEATTGDPPDPDYPIGLYAEIYVVPKDMGKKYKEEVVSVSGGDITADTMQLLDAKMYSGGVPATTLLDGVKSAARSDVPSITKQYDGGFRVERYFKTEEDALKYGKEVYAKNATALFGLIGFALDRPINRMGNTGWDVIRHQRTGKGYL